MPETESDKPPNIPKKNGQKKVGGVGASAGSDRREFRRFRPKRPIQSKDKSSVLCKFFTSKDGCRNGDNCRFRHTEVVEKEVTEVDELAKGIDKLDVEQTTESTQSKPTIFLPPSAHENAPERPPPSRVSRPQVIKLKKEQLESEEQKAQFNAEVQYFRRRYRHAKIATEGNGTKIEFRYDVTDPEWVFDVKSMNLSIFLKSGHPIECPKISVPNSRNQCLPEILRGHIEMKMNSAMQIKYESFDEKDAFENIGKALIKWLDREIMKIFVEGLKKTKLVVEAAAAGISLVVPTKQEIVVKDTVDTVDQQNLEEVEYEKDENDDEDESAENEENEEEEEKQETFKPVDVLPIEIVMVWNNVSGKVATVQATSLKICTKCARCGAERYTQVSTNDKVVGWRCEKCAQAESLRIRHEIVHEANNVLGRMDAKGCRPVDCILLDSSFKIVCLSCDREDDLQKLNYGDSHKAWCRACHSSIEMSVSAIRFRGVDAANVAGEDKNVAGAIPKPKKTIEKRSAMVEGQPLPDMGTCKHYKKSFRWFRFPCCGKLYPCDNCHEEATKGEHEMKIANRMVCGHCSKEQVFQKDKPCAGCGEGTTRKRTQFWEGGKGCRDQNRMSKNDGHKFVNSRKKTVAKSKVAELATKKK